MNEENDIFTKEAIETDLALINISLKLIRHSVKEQTKNGTDFSNEELHVIVSKIDKNLSRIKEYIDWKK